MFEFGDVVRFSSESTAQWLVLGRITDGFSYGAFTIGDVEETDFPAGSYLLSRLTDGEAIPAGYICSQREEFLAPSLPSGTRKETP